MSDDTKTAPETSNPADRARRAVDWTMATFRERPYVATFAVVSVICIFLMIFVDQWVVQDIKIQGGPAFTQLFADYGIVGRAEWFIGAAAIVIIFSQFALYFNLVDETRLRVRRYINAAMFMIAAILAGGIVVNVAKTIIGRVRPRELFENGFYGFQPLNTDFGMNSFPSGHSQLAFSVAMAMYLIYPRYDVLYFAFAISVAASRVFATVHFPADVLMGSLVGIICTLLVKKHFFDARGIEIQLSFERDIKLAQAEDTPGRYAEPAKLAAPDSNPETSDKPLRPFPSSRDGQ